MKILLTGCNEFIGFSLAKKLLKKIKKIQLTSNEQGIKNTFNWFKQSSYNNKSK